MNRSVWLTGPSGTGKSTFAKSISDRYKIPIKKEVTRASDNLLRTNFATRQMFFGLSYINRHASSATTSFISDRCILDYIFWTIYNGHENHSLMDEFMGVIEEWMYPTDVYVVIPMPSKEMFKREIFPNFLNDPLRYSIYIGKHHDIYGYTPYTEDEFATFLYNMSQKMQEGIQRVLQNNMTSLNINVITPKPRKNNYWSWQDVATEHLDKLFDRTISEKNSIIFSGEDREKITIHGLDGSQTYHFSKEWEDGSRKTD